VNTITFDLEIYTYHINFAGCVGPIAYSQWLDVAWLKLLEAIALPRHQLANEDLEPILTATTIQYWQPVFLGDRLRTEIGITRLDAAIIDLKVWFYNTADQAVAEATQSWVFTDSQAGLPKALTPDIAARFQPYFRPTEA
jgi:acyl-CoA thioester hydrolase